MFIFFFIIVGIIVISSKISYMVLSLIIDVTVRPQAPASDSRTLRRRSQTNSSCDCPRTLGVGGAGAPPRRPPPPPRAPPPRGARAPPRRRAPPLRRRRRLPARTHCACPRRTWCWWPTAAPGLPQVRSLTSSRHTLRQNWRWLGQTISGRRCLLPDARRSSRGLRCPYEWTARNRRGRVASA